MHAIIFSFKYIHLQTKYWFRYELSVWCPLSYILPQGHFLCCYYHHIVQLICKFSVSQYFMNVSVPRSSTDNKNLCKLEKRGK